jgi:hypothetical protein
MQASCPVAPPTVRHRPVGREVELVGEGLEIGEADPAHRIHELLEPLGIGIKLFEHRLARMLDLVLRLAGLERGRQIAPERVQARIGHFEDAADIGRAAPDQETAGLRRVAVAGAGAGAIAAKQVERDQRVEEIGRGARVEAEAGFDLGAGHGPFGKQREQAELDRAQQRLGGPEAHPDLQEALGRGRGQG